MTDCVIVDIDGTLANCDHRRHLVMTVSKKDKNWKLFKSHDLVMQDTLIEPVAKMVHALNRHYQIIYLSGRDNDCYDTTKEWLRKHGMWFYPFLLYVRPEGDTRPDTVFKLEMLERIRELGYRPFLAIDDRNCVVQAWRDAGLVCAQVAPGDF